MVEFPLINGKTPSFSDISIVGMAGMGLFFDVGEVAGVTSNGALEIGRQRAGGKTVKRTTGQTSEEASLSFYQSGWVNFLRRLQALAPRNGKGQVQIALVEFDLDVIWMPAVMLSAIPDTNLYHRRIKGCKIMGRELSSQEGADPNKIEVPLDPLEVCDVVDGQEFVLI
jgi:hypothetical protein